MTPSSLPIDQILKGHTQSLLKALRLLHEHDGPGVKAPLDPINQQQLLESLQQQSEYFPDRLLLTGYLKHHFSDRLLGADIRAALPFVDLLISQLYLGAAPDKNIDISGRRLSLALIIRLLGRPDIAINTEHPLCEFIHRLFNHLSIWEAAAGKTGRRFSEWLDNLAAILPELDINSSSTVKELSQQLSAHIEEDQRHQQKLEQRIIDSQDAHHQIDNARDTVHSFIARRLSGQQLPEDIAGFIHNQLIADLQYLLIHRGVDCPEWKKWQRLLQALSWAFAQTDSDAHRKKVMTLLPPIIDQIDDSYWQHFPKDHHYAEFFQILSDYFVLVLQSIPIQCVSFSGIEYNNEQTPNAVVDQTMVDDLERFQEGDWFTFKAENPDSPPLKGKLLMKLPQQDRLLFVRYNGRKLAEYSYADFSLALATKVAKLIRRKHLYARTLKTTLQQLDRRYQHHLKLEQRIAETQARDLAASKARREAEQLQQPPAQQTKSNVSEDRKQTLRETLSALHVGAWLELQSESQEAKRLKLSVKLQASDKYIFTDRLGQKAADHNLAELVELMADGQLSILSQGEHFENSLEKVVRGLRKSTP